MFHNWDLHIWEFFSNWIFLNWLSGFPDNYTPPPGERRTLILTHESDFDLSISLIIRTTHSCVTPRFFFHILIFISVHQEIFNSKLFSKMLEFRTNWQNKITLIFVYKSHSKIINSLTKWYWIHFVISPRMLQTQWRRRTGCGSGTLRMRSYRWKSSRETDCTSLW